MEACIYVREREEIEASACCRNADRQTPTPQAPTPQAPGTGDYTENFISVSMMKK